MAHLKTREQIEAMVAERGIQYLRDAITFGRLRDAPFVQAWLDEQERIGKVERESAELELMRRQAAASERSAGAAETSARWAMFSAAIAMVAVIVAVSLH